LIERELHAHLTAHSRALRQILAELSLCLPHALQVWVLCDRILERTKLTPKALHILLPLSSRIGVVIKVVLPALAELPMRSIDTGMGLDRMAADDIDRL